MKIVSCNEALYAFYLPRRPSIHIYPISFNGNESSRSHSPSTLKYSRARDKKLYVIVYTFILFFFFYLTFLSLFL